MPTPEETGISKPRRGPCEKCGGKAGLRRHYEFAQFILCADCARGMGIRPSAPRPSRHKYGGGSGKVRP